jgi:hypothetical protein
MHADHALEPVGDRVLRRQRQHVARRALKHRHVRRAAGHRGQNRDGGRAAPDDHDPLAGVVEVRRPELRVHDGAGELLDALELRREALLVVEIARADEQEAGCQLDGLAVVAPRRHRPARCLRRPARGADVVAEADMALEVVLGDRLVQVVEDQVAGRDRAVRRPWLERVPEREEVGVRADAREAEQVPRAADRVASL